MVSGLISLFANVKMEGSRADFDLIGRVHEYFIGELASSEGKCGGEFHTPKPVAELLVEMIEPMDGRLYEPCYGTGSFFMQSERYIEEHAGRRDNLAIYGQELKHTTYGLARMNLAIRGVSADLRWNAQGTLLKDEFANEKFEFVLANPPFNVRHPDLSLPLDPRARPIG